MNHKLKPLVIAAILAAAIAVSIRITVLTDDCNLVVMAMLWTVLFVALYAVSALYKAISRRRR